MASSAAMVQALIVKAAGIGGIGKLDCSEVKAAFGIVSGRYKDLDIDKGENREHGGAPAGAFYESGRGAPGDVKMPGCGKYDPDNAWCWNVDDGQTHNTEHRYLTDRMAEFQSSNGGGQKTLTEHMDAYQKAAEDCLVDGDRAPDLKDPERREMAKRAAECMREEQEAAYAKDDCKVDGKTKLRAQSLPLRSTRPTTLRRR